MKKEEILEVEPVNASSGTSWVVEMENMLGDTNRLVEMARWSKPSIYRVPEWLKNMIADRTVYHPRLVSLGPFHHGEEHLKPMEEHKRRAVLHIVKRSRKPLREFAAAIEEVADELLDAYDNLDDKWRGQDRDRFVEMMVLDGCFLLEMLKGVSSKESEKDINSLVLGFVWNPLKDEDKLSERIVDDKVCLHPLDIYHKNFCGLHPATPGTEIKWASSMRCAVELKEAGIHLKKCDNTHVIDFKSRVLSLPTVSIGHDGTEKIFLNLMAFERLHSDAGSEATDYMIFMDNIIDSERDVALLRSKGIIKNLLSSDKEAAQLFNNLSRGAVLSPFSRLHEVRRKVNAHCTKPWNRWRAIFQHTYMSNPWVLISLMAAAILLIATLLQTIYSVLGLHNR